MIFNHGRVEAVGSYDSLRETGLDFAKLLADPTVDEKDESSLHRSRSGSRINRQSSISSSTSLDDKPGENPMQVDETRSDGSISWSIYGKYFKAGGGFCFFYIMVIFCVGAQVLASGGDFFLSIWYVSFIIVILFSISFSWNSVFNSFIEFYNVLIYHFFKYL